ncbi:MAG: N-acetyl-gamma-glutamyl-phosphate reductase [Bacteroidia bacterium]|nr:N-acetyl-gamma-glutamyl-phosphate reductase [Bacteroidia bacterium]MCC6768300.1 N-acetyl-gamma-glutamyl-phosphate reductase [Bacteroidia bacterium]
MTFEQITLKRVGIAGAAGYTGGELIRLLLNHPGVELCWLHSRSNAGKRLDEVHHDLLGETELRFTEPDFQQIDFLFLCLGHGESRKYLLEHQVPKHIRIIDLSQDFRLDENWVYGLPELNRTAIRSSGKNIANPGCFATTIQLALLPLAARQLLNDDIHISAITGSTGAGQSLSQSSHFSWRSNNVSNYKTLDHQHLAEIGRTLRNLQPEGLQEIRFIPYRGSFTRGIFATVYIPTTLSIEDANTLFQQAYHEHPFVWLSHIPVDIKQVVNTNKCFLYLEKKDDMLVISSVTDNLLKGASGQAVQNFNLLAGFAEDTGLRLKPSAF